MVYNYTRFAELCQRSYSPVFVLCSSFNGTRYAKDVISSKKGVQTNRNEEIRRYWHMFQAAETELLAEYQSDLWVWSCSLDKDLMYSNQVIIRYFVHLC